MKYVIEIKPEFEGSFKGLMILGAKESNLYVDTLAVENLEPLNAEYINEHFPDLLDNAYAHGKSDAEADYHKAKEEAYQKGLEDAWEVAKRIWEMGQRKRRELFGEPLFCEAMKMPYSEALAKLQAYEQKQKEDAEIKVGDEVMCISSCVHGTAIVTKVDDGTYYYTYADGRCDHNNRDVTKTGRHFPEVAQFLEKMKGE